MKRGNLTYSFTTFFFSYIGKRFRKLAQSLQEIFLGSEIRIERSPFFSDLFCASQTLFFFSFFLEISKVLVGHFLPWNTFLHDLILRKATSLVISLLTLYLMSFNNDSDEQPLRQIGLTHSMSSCVGVKFINRVFNKAPTRNFWGKALFKKFC